MCTLNQQGSDLLCNKNGIRRTLVSGDWPSKLPFSGFFLFSTPFPYVLRKVDYVSPHTERKRATNVIGRSGRRRAKIVSPKPSRVGGWPHIQLNGSNNETHSEGCSPCCIHDVDQMYAGAHGNLCTRSDDDLSTYGRCTWIDAGQQVLVRH